MCLLSPLGRWQGFALEPASEGRSTANLHAGDLLERRRAAGEVHGLGVSSSAHPVDDAVQASARIRPIAPPAKEALSADAPPERALVRADADAFWALVPGEARPDEHHAPVPSSPEEADIPRAEVVLELGVRLPADDAPFDDGSGPPQTVPHVRAGHAELDRADPDAVLDWEALRRRPSRRRRSDYGDNRESDES